MIQVYRPKPKSNLSKQPQVGIYVSKPQKDINSKNRNDYIFIPDRPSASIKKRLSLKVNTVGDPFDFFVFNDVRTYTTVYKHGFGYIPEIIAFVTTADDFPAAIQEGTGSYINVPSTWQNGDEAFGSQHFEVFNAYADDQNLYVTASRYHFMSQVGVWNLDGSYTFDILLLMEEAK